MSLKLKLFTVQFDPGSGNFDDGLVRRFLADKQLIEVRDHFFTQDGLAHLVLLLVYRTEAAEVEPGNTTESDKEDKAVKQSTVRLLSETDRNLYDTFREWRNERAREDGVPVFLIASNAMLLEVVSHRPGSLQKLREIKGFGEAKVRKYGSEILSLLSPADEDV